MKITTTIYLDLRRVDKNILNKVNFPHEVYLELEKVASGGKLYDSHKSRPFYLAHKRIIYWNIPKGKIRLILCGKRLNIDTYDKRFISLERYLGEL